LFVTSPKTRWVQVVVGLGSWLVFVVDLIVQLRIAPDYLRRRNGKIDLGIVVLTFLIYLIPGISGNSAILLLARLARVGDALWWGIVTLTTVGYGDIVPKTTTGRLCGVVIMFTGIAVLGVLAGSLASLFNLQGSSDSDSHEDRDAEAGADPTAGRSLPVELAALQAQLQAVERRLGELAQFIAAPRGDPD
jgi:voltage-gated potassium channel